MDFYWIDADGNSTQLGQLSTTKVKSYSGLGFASLDYWLQPLAFEHQQAWLGFQYRPRLVQLGIWDVQASATAAETRRQTLYTALNADLGEGILKIVLDNGGLL